MNSLLVALSEAPPPEWWEVGLLVAGCALMWGIICDAASGLF